MAGSENKAKRQQYPMEKMEAAIKSVKDEGITAWKASKMHEIPYQTLLDKLNGSHKGKIGAKTLFTAEEEKDFEDWIEDFARQAQPRTQTQFLQAVKDASDIKYPNEKKFGEKGAYDSGFLILIEIVVYLKEK